MPHRPLTYLKPVAAAAAAGTGAIGGVGLLAFVQARLAGIGGAASYPVHWLDGDVGPADASAHRVVWLGDSLAAGLGAIAPDVTLPRLVASHSDRSTRLHVFATPGATSVDVVACQLPALIQLRHGLGQIGRTVDAVGVTVGANDIAAFTGRRRFRRNIAAIASAAGDAPVILVSIPGLADALRLPHPLRALASVRGRWLDRVLQDAARSSDRIHYVNVWQRPPWIERRHRAHFLSGDRYHPSGAGYAVWADRVAHAFELALRPATS